MSKVTAKGRTTIPQEVRAQLQIEAGDLLHFAWEDGKLVLRKFSKGEALYLKGLLSQFPEWGSSDDDGLV